MAQGTRGRLALLGTGLLFCLGCMEPDPKPIGKPPLSKGPPSMMGSTVKPNQPAYGAGVQPAGYSTTGRPPADKNYFNTGSMAPSVPGAAGTGTSMAPPSSLTPPLTPGGYTGSAAPRTVTPPPGFDNPSPPYAPGPTSTYPMAPVAPTMNPLFGGN